MQKQARKIGVVLALAVEQGRISTSQVGDFMRLAHAEYEATLSALAHLKAAAVPTCTTAQQQWGFNEWRQFAPKALAQMQLNAPARYEALRDLYTAEIRSRYSWMKPSGTAN